MGRVSNRGRLCRDLVWLVGATLVVRLLSALWLERPGYMDAAYYVNGALSLYQGRGFNDPFLWNYLDDPAGIPHPSHLYWMPLSSILAYLSFLVFGPTYRAAQVPFTLLSSLLPVLSYLVAFDVAQSRRHALCAGLLTTFSAFYMAYWVTPDNFAPYAVAGTLCLWALGQGLKSGKVAWFCVSGLGAGLAHLSRADGLLLVGAVLLAGVAEAVRCKERIGPLALGCLCCVLCYLAVMGPWFIRNVAAIGSPLPTSGLQSAWLTRYEDLYGYGVPPTVRSYLAWGWANILHSKLYALWINAQTVLIVEWMIFLAPLGLAGVWRLRRRVEFRWAWLYGALLYGVMSLVFTFPGWRGGMLHSAIALLPFLYAAAMDGLDAFVAWMTRRRRTWRLAQATTVFSVALVGFAVVLSGVLYARGLDKYRGDHLYDAVAAWMDENAPPTERLMVNDPAQFYYHGRRESLSIPYADLQTVLEVMERYSTRYILLDEHNDSLSSLYAAPYADRRLAVAHVFTSGGQQGAYLFVRTDTQ